jgi:hypothetical protein
MNRARLKAERSSRKPQKAKGATILGGNGPIGGTVDCTSYSNGTFRLPRLGAEAPNNRHRASAAISAAKAKDLADAVEHAGVIGLPLVKFITIHFAVAGLAETIRPQEAVGKFLKLASQWLRSKGHGFAYVWVLERVTSIREHVHLMCSCPDALAAEFNRKANGVWMEKAGMLTAREARKRAKAQGRDSKAIEIERIGLRGYHPSTADWQRAYRNQVTGTLLYHLKGIDPDQFPANDDGDCVIRTSSGATLVIKPEHEGTIFGRRCSRSENISDKARRTYWAMHQPDAA